MRGEIGKSIYVCWGLVGLASLLAIILASDYSYAETTSATASVTVAAACTMTANTTSAHSAIVSPGQYTEPIGSTTLSVICNDAGGFSIYAVGNANNEYGNNKLLATLNGTLNSTYDIVTGTATSGNTSNWAMKINAVTGTYTPTIQSDTNGSFSSYHIVPTTYTKVASYNSVTGTSVASEVTSTYAAYIKPDQPAGNYDGKVKYTMVHPVSETPARPQTCPSGKICYFANANDIEGTMGQQYLDSSSSTMAVLLASNFSRIGYGFAGWSDKYDYESNPNAHFYGPQETITFTAGQYYGTNKGLPLYAVWIKSAGSLQDTSKVATLCGTGIGSLTTAPTDGTANLASVSALTDQRDNETYAIAKLADGKCWMIENLRLESTAAHNSDGALAQGYGVSSTYGSFSGLADSEFPWLDDSTLANSLYSTDGSNSTINIGISNDPAYRMPRYNNVNTPTIASDRPQNPTSNDYINDVSNAGLYSYGNYYTWPAVVADMSPNSVDNVSVTSTSICPTGWRLPMGGDKTNEINNDFWKLIVIGINEGVKPANYDNKDEPYYSVSEASLVDVKLRSYPNNYVHAGGVNSGSISSRGSYSYYWTSTSLGARNAYKSIYGGTVVYPGGSYSAKSMGWTIRCMVSPGA